MTDKIKKYYELFERWNAKLNLMSVSNFEEFLAKHVEDARALLPYLEGAKSMIDLGTGGGVPGMVVKIEMPELAVTLLDSTSKKISFLDEAIRKLELKNIRTVWGRAEDEKIWRSVGKFDAVISRATWELKNYIPVAEKYLNEGGRCIAMKGPKWHAELEAAANEIAGTDLKLEGAHEYKLADDSKRCILVFVKK